MPKTAIANPDDLSRRFDIVEHRLSIGEHHFELRHPRSADALISDDDFNRDERLPYWAEIWPSAYVLAQWIAARPASAWLGALPARRESPQQQRQPRLLELGCGAGLGVVTALASGFSVTAIDYYADALEFVHINAALNQLPMPETRVVDWRQYPENLVDFDIVVAADVLYERDYSRLIAAAFKKSLRPGGLGILTDPQRSKAEAFPGRMPQSRPFNFNTPGLRPAQRPRRRFWRPSNSKLIRNSHNLRYLALRPLAIAGQAVLSICYRFRYVTMMSLNTDGLL